MVDWSALRDVYGPADAIPALLDLAAATTDWSDPSWAELWGRLYHQGSTSSASYAALPQLIAIACSRADVASDPALFLVAALWSATDKPAHRDAAMAECAGDTGALRTLAQRKLELSSDPHDFLYALQNVSAFEGLGAEQLLEGLANDEVELECSACGDHLYLEVVGDHVVATLDPDATADLRPLEPTTTSALGPRQARLVDLAGGHGQRRVQHLLASTLGRFTCPACGQPTSAVALDAASAPKGQA